MNNEHISSGRGALFNSVLFPRIVSAMTSGPAAYTMRELARSYAKPMRGKTVGCHVCGMTRVTLYKDGDRRICAKCRKKIHGGGAHHEGH